MPFGRITVAADEITSVQEEALVTGLTQRLAQDLNKQPAVTVIHLNRVPPSTWFIEGKRSTGVGLHVEVSITAGTNTEHEKSEFVRNVHELLTSTVPLAASTVYVALYELSGDAYGYGGVTQAARYGL